MTTKRIVELDTVSKAIHALFDLRRRDSMEGRTNIRIDPQHEFTLSYGPPDHRRNANHVELDDCSRWCFCDGPRLANWSADFDESDTTRYVNYNESSAFCLRPKLGRALQYSIRCGPEPSPETFRDMLEIASVLDDRALTVVNLPGSGASVPAHFHTQIHAMKYQSDDRLEDDSIARMWRSISHSGDSLTLRNNIVIDTVDRPVWGVTIDFSNYLRDHEEISRISKVSRLLFESVHRAVRYRSQLSLAYNLYIHSQKWNRITVLFRESRLERVCATPEMFGLIERRVGRDKAEKIGRSDNQHWRWGWWEMIGGLFARDDSFAQDGFDIQFWLDVYDILTIPRKYRGRIFYELWAALV